MTPTSLARSALARACAVAMILAVALGTACSRPETQRPNIVFIFTDDQATSTLQYMPHLDRHLVQEGLTFRNFVINSAMCCPSRVSIALGLYRHNHGFAGSNSGGCALRFFTEGQHRSSLATRLADAGYRTGFVGKYLNRYGAYEEKTQDKQAGDHLLTGWTDYHVLGTVDYFGFVLHENGRTTRYDRGEYQTDVLSARAVEFVDRAAREAEPFFLYVAPYAPHHPFEPAPRHRGSFQELRAPRSASFNEANVQDKPSHVRRGLLTPVQIATVDSMYRRSVRTLQAVDEMVDAIVSSLAASNELDDTYIIYASDNGHHFGEHRIPTSKGTPYEESVTVPLIIRGPGVRRGEVVADLASNVDIFPTILDLAEIPSVEAVDGRSLRPLLEHVHQRDGWRQALLLDYVHGPARVKIPEFVGLRTRDYKLVEYPNGERELYHLGDDEYELDNIYHSADPRIVEALASRLQALRRCAGQECRDQEDRELGLVSSTGPPTSP